MSVQFTPIYNAIRALTCILGLSLCAWGTANACTATACGPEMVGLLYTTASGLVYVQPSSSVAALSCTTVSGTYIVLNPAAANFRELYAALLSAKISGSNVTIAMDVTQSTCTVGYVLNN